MGEVINATAPDQLEDLVTRMITVDHPVIKLQDSTSSEEGRIVMSVILPDSEPAFEWVSPRKEWKKYVHCLWIYKCRKALLVIDNVEEYTVSNESPLDDTADDELEGIAYDNKILTVSGIWKDPFVRAKVNSLHVSLLITDEVVDVLAVHQQPTGLQSLTYGVDKLREVAKQAGLELSTVAVLNEWDVG